MDRHHTVLWDSAESFFDTARDIADLHGDGAGKDFALANLNQPALAVRAIPCVSGPLLLPLLVEPCEFFLLRGAPSAFIFTPPLRLLPLLGNQRVEVIAPVHYCALPSKRGSDLR